jgi:hypothetical protein
LSLHSTRKGALGTAVRRDHVVQFRRHCHHLIAVGYKEIRAEQHFKSEEDFITQRLVEVIRAAQRGKTLPNWADRYFVRDQVPVSGAGRVGKKRHVIDIEFESTESRDRPLFHFEGKRLRKDRSDSVAEYLGREGLGSFLAGLYARSGDEGGMLGYVQSGSPQHWAEAIRRKLQRDPKTKHRLTRDGAWAAIRLIPALEHAYATRHNRPTLGNITIFHTLLSF